ncbi:hypothetical protein E24_00186 [Faustovirus]|nr:hypothetical protein PRJ_Fausto_00172 [Faustovirus]AMN83117.1 hypothetical protein E24_00186 [Faustovirus]AMN84098.1 hypothetical protein D5a_00185 [Faustovirus]AMN85086.1 hypothetical protein E23_00185 [Faustovirus]QBR99085.1 hypothetical protein [Faustovirus mariensis]
MEELIEDVVGVIIKHVVELDFGISKIAFALTNKRLYKISIKNNQGIKCSQTVISLIKHHLAQGGILYWRSFADVFYGRILNNQVGYGYIHACESYMSTSSDYTPRWRAALAIRAAESSVLAFIHICEFFQCEIKIWYNDFMNLCKILENKQMSKSKFKKYTTKMFQFAIYNESTYTIDCIICCSKRFYHQLKSMYFDYNNQDRWW